MKHNEDHLQVIWVNHIAACLQTPLFIQAEKGEL